MRRGLLLSLLVSLALPAAAIAQTPVSTPFGLVPVAEDVMQIVNGLDPVSAAAYPICTPKYRNQLAYFSYVNQNGNELMDDLHTDAVGLEPLCVYEIAFYNLSGNPTNATVTIYDNDASDGAPGSILAGPFQIYGLPAGGVRAMYAPLSGMIDEDVWMGVSFSAFKGTGLQIADPVMVGMSHDIAYSPRYGYLNFGGPPNLPANFVMSVTTQAPVPTINTWGALKATYR